MKFGCYQREEVRLTDHRYHWWVGEREGFVRHWG